jgi:uncharacterized membrane protein (DUF2068 family)
LKLTMASEARPHAAEDLALRSIVLYKVAKSSLTLVAAVALVALWPFGLPDWIAHLAVRLRHHFVQAWTVHVADWLVKNTSRHRIELTIAALFMDGTLTGIEGWSLHRRYWWGPWLVVVATGGLLPVEVYEWIRHRHLGRAVLFVVNLAIVLFLARHAWREHRSRKSA